MTMATAVRRDESRRYTTDTASSRFHKKSLPRREGFFIIVKEKTSFQLPDFAPLLPQQRAPRGPRLPAEGVDQGGADGSK